MGVASSAAHDVCGKAVSDLSLAVAQELFAQQKTVHQMLFVIEGELKYKYPGPEGATSSIISKDQWACEAVLWARKVDIYGPFVAGSTCDAILLNATEFRSIAQIYPDSFIVLV